MSHPLDTLRQTVQALVHDSSETVEPWHSFWHHRPTRDFPPRSVQQPEDWAGGERLSVACTQTSLTAGAQKKLVQRWCELLPTLGDVRFLWFQSKVTPALFEAACAMPGLEGLYVKWSGVTDFTPIRQRAGSLRYLHMGSSPSLAPLDVLAELPRLEWLELHNVRAAADLDFVRALTGLRGLSLTGDTNSSKVLNIASLLPLAGLPALQWLRLGAVNVGDHSLLPLATLPALKYLLLNNRLPWEAVAELAALRPDIDCDLFTPVSPPVNWLTCKTCKAKTMVALTGKGQPWLCTTCDADRITRHEQAFARAVAEARRAQQHNH